MSRNVICKGICISVILSKNQEYVDLKVMAMDRPMNYLSLHWPLQHQAAHHIQQCFRAIHGALPVCSVMRPVLHYPFAALFTAGKQDQVLD